MRYTSCLALVNDPRWMALVGGQRKESPDLVQPGAVGWDEVHVPVWPDCQPSLGLRMGVGRVVVHEAMDTQFARNSFVDLAQERQGLLMTRASTAPLRTLNAANNVMVPWRFSGQRPRHRPTTSSCVRTTATANALARSTHHRLSVCLLSSRYLCCKDTALACNTKASYLQDRTLG